MKLQIFVQKLVQFYKNNEKNCSYFMSGNQLIKMVMGDI
jgi:hypothetical protein